MITYPDQPDTDPIKDDTSLNDTLYVLRSAYTYVTLSNQTIIIPEGFRTDEVSIPPAAWTILSMSPDGYYRAAGVVHDYLYATSGESGKYKRKDCDKILREIMKREDVSWFQRNACYLAVRVFGGKHWVSATK